MDELQPGNALPQGERSDLPVRQVTVNSIVALNLAYFRKAAGLTQEELGERIGWGKSVISTAERSWDAKRVRSFSAEDLVGIAVALQVPLAALFLPPEDDGTAFRYVLDMPRSEDGELRDLLTYVFPVNEGDSPVMNAYRKRLIAATVSDGEPAEPRESDAQARLQVIGTLAHARAELERRIDDLRAFEREYRTRLQTYVEGQLLELYTPETRPLAERRIKEVLERAAAGGTLGVSALVLREDGTYAALHYPPGDQDRAQAEQTQEVTEGDGE